MTSSEVWRKEALSLTDQALGSYQFIGTLYNYILLISTHYEESLTCWTIKLLSVSIAGSSYVA